uniref:sigma-70 family RNA polymerase sigma factor n=1 Tax=Streptomyces sp. GSL17-111 TaxID=3121596 RepID=UPI0030F4A2E0
MREGDSVAYDEVYRRHADAVRRYARSCCRDVDTADDLTNEVFARTLQAVRRGKGPRTALRAYLLASVRHAAAAWARTTRREQLVEDFAAFAVAAAGGRGAAADETLAFGAEVQAMHEAEHSMVVQAFRTLPERWQTVLWHTTVEESPPSEVAPLLGLSANATAVLAHRAREGLKQAYLQAHVSRSLTADAECARYAERIGAYTRGGLRTRAERGLRRHLEECARCRTAALEVGDVNTRLRALLPVAVIGWFAATYAVKAAAGALGGAGAVAGAGSAAAAGGVAGSGGSAGAGGAAAEGLGAPAKAGIAAGALTAAAAAVALVLALAGSPRQAEPPPPQAAPSTPHRTPEAAPPVVPEPEPDPVAVPVPPPPDPDPEPSPRPPRTAASPPPAPQPVPTRRSPSPAPSPAPVPAGYPLAELPYDVLNGISTPEYPALLLARSSPVWPRSGLRIAEERYAHGITVQAPSSVLVGLGGACVGYEALAGVDDLTMGLGAVRFVVSGDGRELWRSGVVSGGEPPVRVAVPVTGVETLRLAVEPVGPYGHVAQADWAQSVVSCR